MSYKKYFIGLFVICFVVLITRVLLAYLIDPVGIWGAPIVQGLNHYKVKQEGYLDVYKPYEYIREAPDILYIGASQMYVGFEPTCGIKSTQKVYTLGLSALSLPHMREYLQFVYKVHKPETIYIGINFYLFGKHSYELKRIGYSKKRLLALGGGGIYESWMQGIVDSMGSLGTNIPTMCESMRHVGQKPLFLHGWDTRRGTARSVHVQTYYDYLFTVTKEYGEWIYSSEAMECFKVIIQEAKEAGVPIIVFFTPLSVDGYATMQLMGKGAELQRIKREVAEILPVYDFAFVNELTTNRQEYFYDVLHFRAVAGEKLKGILEGGNPSGIGYLLDPETADAVFAAENMAWESWRNENKAFMDALGKDIEARRRPEVGDYAEYIGF